MCCLRLRTLLLALFYLVLIDTALHCTTFSLFVAGKTKSKNIFYKAEGCQPNLIIMSKRKGRKRKTTDVTAEALIATGAQAIVVSAGTDETILTNLIRLCKKMKSAASKQLKVVKLSAAKCGQNGCKNKSDKHCGICSVAICDECLEDPCGVCCECEKPCCEDCGQTCDFNDGGGNGCGDTVCVNCVVTTKCEREVGGCQQCLDDYDCPDCDQCDGYW